VQTNSSPKGQSMASTPTRNPARPLETRPSRRPCAPRTPLLNSPALIVLCAISAIGCSSGEKVGQVQGRVSVNGQPVAEGDIRFLPMDGGSRATGGLITNGAFDVEVPVGKQRVEIFSNVIDEAKTPPNPTPEQIVMKKLVPDRYNIESEEVLEVKPGLNEPVFDLKSP
jgi:hypothetical protein